MEKTHKNILTGARVFLVQNLEIDSLFLSYLISDGVFQTQHEEEINAERTNNDKVRRFIDLLLRRGPLAFKSFLSALIHTNQHFISKTLEPELAARLEQEIEKEDDEASDDHSDSDKVSMTLTDDAGAPSKEVEVPPCIDVNTTDHHKSPNQEVFTDCSSKNELVKEAIKDAIMNGEEVLEYSLNYKVERPVEEDDCYPCTQTPVGVVYVLNVCFRESALERVGGTADVKNIQNLFHHMGYLVVMIKENKLHDIRRKIQDIKTSPLLSTVGTFLMFLMSHGKNGHLLDADGQHMSISKEFILPFLSDQCPQLLKKPKLFFIQSCRGDKIHFDHLGDQEKEELLKEDTFPHSNPSSTHPYTDVFKFFSTPENYKSIRLSTGSIFIRCLLLTIASFCHHQPLDFMVKCVNSIMDSLEVEYHKIGRNLKQVSTAESSLTKDVFFNPRRPF